MTPLYGGLFNPTLEDVLCPSHSPTSAGAGARNEGLDPGHAAPVRGPSSHLVAGISPAPFCAGNGGMKANQRRWHWGVSFPQALCRLGHPNLCRGCFRSSLETAALQLRETVWSPLGNSAGTWPQGRLRCCAENGAKQAWLGMAVLAMRHLVSTCEGTALGVGWDGERTWGELGQPEPPASTGLTLLRLGEWVCWPEGVWGSALPPEWPHQVCHLQVA